MRSASTSRPRKRRSLYLGSVRIGISDKGTKRLLLIERLRNDEAIAEAGTLLLTVPNQLGIAYTAHVLEAILTYAALALSWR
jgi:hypothetical protein